MPVYRCNKCGHVSESPTAGTQVPCAKCQTPCSVFDTVFYVGKLIERYTAAMREIKALQANDEPESASPPPPQVPAPTPTNPAAPPADTVAQPLNTAAQHAPIENWLASMQIEAQFDHSSVDTSGYFDEAALALGERHDLFGELIQRVAYAYRKDHTGLNINLSEVAQKDAQAIQALCRQLYSHTLFARYHYQKNEKVVQLGLQSAPKVRQFFTGAWLEWFALMKGIAALQHRQTAFSCARGVRVLFSNEDVHELDVVLLPAGRAPICIECKAGEFRRDIHKYERLRKRLGVEPTRFLICSTDISDEQAVGLSAMYDLTFVSVAALPRRLSSLI